MKEFIKPIHNPPALELLEELIRDPSLKYKIGITGHRKLLQSPKIISSRIRDYFLSVLSIPFNSKDPAIITSEVSNIMDPQDPISPHSIQLNPPETLLVFSGMALGFDQLVCQVCLSLNIPYIACIPCLDQNKFWTDEQNSLYKELLNKAKLSIVVSPGNYVPWKMFARNRFIVDHADKMLIHWDGLYEGGTGGCMKLVKSKKIDFFNTTSESSSL